MGREKYINDTIEQFMRYNAGHDIFDIPIADRKLQTGGKAHLIVYMGHNALMDYAGVKNILFSNPAAAEQNPDNDAVVLACKSRPYFEDYLKETAAHPLILTEGLMAPEAYSLHSAIEPWIAGENDIQIRRAAAAGYNQYQKTGRKAAEWLFGVK